MIQISNWLINCYVTFEFIKWFISTLICINLVKSTFRLKINIWPALVNSVILIIFNFDLMLLLLLFHFLCFLRFFSLSNEWFSILFVRIFCVFTYWFRFYVTWTLWNCHAVSWIPRVYLIFWIFLVRLFV